MPNRKAALPILYALLGISAIAFGTRFYYPDGIYFDARTIYYDVADLVAELDSSPPFSSTEALVAHLNTHAPHDSELPTLMARLDKPVVIAWGTAEDHYHLRRVLRSVRTQHGY